MSDDQPARMQFAWDPAKAHSNLAKHGVAFIEAATVLLDPLALTVFDPAHSATEDRWFTLGCSSGGKLLALAHTYTIVAGGSALIRIISARLATRNERVQYENVR